MAKQAEIAKMRELVEIAEGKTLEYSDFITPKPWGIEIIVEQNDLFVIKRLYVMKGERLSLQYHEKKRETIMYLDGRGQIFKNGEYYPMTKDGDVVRINPYQIHRIEADKDSSLRLLEVSSPELDDVVRIKDKYGRA
mgnify:CR=1 FL=1